MPPKTIDNLGLDISTRYAEDQQKLDRSIIKEARLIPTQTEIDVTLPSFSSEFELLFNLQRKQSVWATFPPPLGYHEQKKRLFTYNLIPSLGSEDKKEIQQERIQTRFLERKQKNKSKESLLDDYNEGEEEEQEPDEAWAKLKEEEEEKQQKVISQLLDKIILLDRYLIEINSRRSQYQKG